jgi:nitroreductase
MLTVQQAAEQRRSIRKYKDQAIPESDIREMLRIASLAPSPWNLQPWRVEVVQTPEMKEKLMAAAYGQPQVGAAPVVFAIWSDMPNVLEKVEDTIHPGMADRTESIAKEMRETFAKYEQGELYWWGRGQAYTFFGYLMLAAQALGYSSSPMLGFVPEQVREVLGLPKDAPIAALLAVGVADEEGFPHHRHELERFVRWH